jgi:hypothetical protein
MGLLRAVNRFARFLAASLRVPGHGPTHCQGWSAHDVIAHVAAGSAELADLMALAAVGETRSTRGFDSREAPYRAMSPWRLRLALVHHGLRATWLLARLSRSGRSVDFTGATLTASQIARHAESELVVHRYDLVGLDRVARRHLAAPALVAHAHEVVGAMDRGVLPPPSASPVELLAVWGR